MAETTFKKVYQAPDGTLFESEADVKDYLRKPKIMSALMAITSNNKEICEWLYKQQEFLEDTFSTGTIQRVTKSEKKAIEKAFEALKTVEGLPKACAFITDNAGAFIESFRWPAVKRMDPEEKAALITRSLMGATENNKELVDWIVASKEQIFEAYEAGKVKREVSPKAVEGLAAYRAQKAAEKAAQEATK